MSHCNGFATGASSQYLIYKTCKFVQTKWAWFLEQPEVPAGQPKPDMKEEVELLADIASDILSPTNKAAWDDILEVIPYCFLWDLYTHNLTCLMHLLIH